MISAPLMNEVSEILGGEGYLVGGSVRDNILGRPVKDFDFCTPMLPDDIEAAVRKAGKKPHLAGKRFGTIGFKSQGEDIEITTFRTELYVPGDRKPEVQYTESLVADLSRRDFTMNAIAQNFDGDLIDPFEGKNSLNNREIMPVGRGSDRISEDPLRMLRAVRLATQLAFDINADLMDDIYTLKHELMTVSRERWAQELDKLLLSDNVDLGLSFLKETGLMRIMLPEFASVSSYAKVRAIGLILNKEEKNADHRWAVLINQIGLLNSDSDKDASVITELFADSLSDRFRFSNDRTKLTKSLVAFKQARHRGLWS